MPQINLLPWREELRRKRQRQFINIAAGVAVVMLGIVVLVHVHYSGMIEDQDSRNKFMTEKIVQVDKEIKEIESLEKEKEALLARMKIIQELQSSRPVIVHLFDELAKAIPDPVYFLKLSRKGNQVSVEGVADANEYVSQLMRNLNNSRWLSNPKLSVIQSGKKEYKDSSWFKLTISQTAASKDAKVGQ
ncbi:MAG: PilN domain-containing protein [Gammaproteobacteria bacterium]|nr:PilN domain-containing protein [Gammaproteobacteria bacterium]